MNEMERPINVLLIEDSPLFVELTRKMLHETKSGDFLIECLDNLAAGIERLAGGGIDVVLLDLTLPDSNGLDTFTQLHAAAADVPIVIYTSVDDEALSLSALNQGAADYLVKSEVNANWLARSLIYAIQRNRLTLATTEAAKPGASAVEQSVSIGRSSEAETTWTATLHEQRLVSVVVLEQIKTRLLNLLDRSDCEELRVDLSHVEYVANAAISTLLIMQRRSQRRSKRLVLCEVSAHVREQFSSRRFDKVFHIEGHQ